MSKFVSHIAIFLFCLLPVFCPAQKGTLAVYSIGNGDMAECPLNSGERGWMQMLPMFFGTQVRFADYAIAGKTADAFLNEGHWGAVLDQCREGDYVFISFDNPAAGSVGDKESFRKTLMQFISDTRQRKGIPVLLTPLTAIQEGGSSATIIRDVASREKTAFIDLGEAAGDITGAKGTKSGERLSINEAINIARVAAAEIRRSLPRFTRGDYPDSSENPLPPPPVPGSSADIISSALKLEAALDFNLRQLPATRSGWEAHRSSLRQALLHASGAAVNHSLDLDLHETGEIKRSGYTIKKIYFQTRPGVYATADLYVPDGKGVFPAIINMHGHWPGGKAGEMVQSCAHELALNGYVCLNLDAWGAGERGSVQGIEEYHGSNLGASLFNIGESLLGNQVSDNMRGVDLLCSLPYVDKNNIGATGASGGGNQTMWLSALDERIKAAMPVVSVGSFQSCVMGSNCVCELMPEGLTFTEASGVLALMAPRSVKICSALKDANPAFYPSEMMRTFWNAKGVFALYDAGENIRYQLFNTPHGYWPEMRQAMIGWFDQQLKGAGNGDFKTEKPFTLLPAEQLDVFPGGKRDPLVESTADYCIRKGRLLSDSFYRKKDFDRKQKLTELRGILLLPGIPDGVEDIHQYEVQAGWHRVLLTTRNKHVIPIRYFPSVIKGAPLVILLPGNGQEIKEKMRVDTYIQKGYGVALADLWGRGAAASVQARATDGRLPEFHTLARAELWLGRTIMGEWVSDIANLVTYLRQHYAPSSVTVDAAGEVAVGALMQAALNNNTDTCVLRNCPISYVLDKREGIDVFNMSLHVPGMLKWGDISLAAALVKRGEIIFKNPVSATGKDITGRELSDFKNKFSAVRAACKSDARIFFSE